MCTVTFVPSGNNFFFTSSRDEQAGRPDAELPKIFNTDRERIVYPMDPKSGGSWIAMSESGNVAVLLNGAIKPHQSSQNYRKSRGVVLTDLIKHSSPMSRFEETDFWGIEPFTVIIFDDGKLYSGKWDGQMKWQEEHSVREPRIWSSVTLYHPDAVVKRERWFKNWLEDNPYPGTLDIIHFHQRGGDGDPFNDILMNRERKVFTKSICSVRRSPDTASCRYIDVHHGGHSEIYLPILKTSPLQA